MPNQILIEPVGLSASEADVLMIEKKVGEKLPTDYRNFLLTKNGGYVSHPLAHAIRFNIRWSGQPWSKHLEYASLDCLYTTANLPQVSLAWVHNEKTWSQMRQLVPRDTVPIGRDRASNSILLGIKGENRGKIFFWANDYASIDDTAEPTYDNVGFIANSFTEFLEGLYPWKESSK